MELRSHSCPECTRLIRLCSGLDFFPADGEVRRLLIDSLHGNSRNHDQAKAIIEHWLRTQTTAPKVANLVALARDLRENISLPPGCEICRGEPWIITDRGLSDVVVHEAEL